MRENRAEQSPVQMNKFLTCSEVRDTLVMLLERRVESDGVVIRYRNDDKNM